jgi:hypothetical protein
LGKWTNPPSSRKKISIIWIQSDKINEGIEAKNKTLEHLKKKFKIIHNDEKESEAANFQITELMK